MTKFFQILDLLPIHRLLQISGVVLLVFGLFNLVPALAHAFTSPTIYSFHMLYVFLLAGTNVTRALFEPLVLLGLAEIIKLKKTQPLK